MKRSIGVRTRSPTEIVSSTVRSHADLDSSAIACSHPSNRNFNGAV